MKHLKFLFIPLSLIGLSCSSPLSDTNVTDPSLLEPQLVVSKSIESGARVVAYTADIYDKNYNLVTLQNGSVKINGFSMNERANLFGGEEYYLSGESEVKFALNTAYNFTMTLSDGSQYHGTVKSQSTDLYEFDAPSSQSHKQNMTVTWKDTDPNASMYILMIYDFRTDSSSGSGEQKFTIPNPANGSYTINSSYLTTSQGTIYEVDLTLVSEITGIIDPQFRPGSSTVSDLQITRSVTIN